MLLKKTSMKRCRNGWSTSLIRAWKVDDALVRPKGMAKISKCLWCVQNVIQVHLHLVVAAAELQLGEERVTALISSRSSSTMGMGK
jgi:hypothetical protein